MKIGFIGLGNMGKPMSTNILKNGYDVTVYDIDKNSVELLVGQGAKAATSPKEVAAASDIILLSLPNPHIVKEVVAGKNGVLEGIKENAIIADLSTVTPKTIIDLVPLVEERGSKILDAPVSGGVPGAKAGKLTIMVGGDKEVFEKCKPVFKTIAKNIYYVGQIGSGLKVKLINQYLFASNLASVVEAFALAAKAGVDAKKLVEVISNSSGSSYALKTRYNYISQNNFEPGFQINLMLKDLSLVLSMAEDNDMPLLLGGMVHQLYRLAKRKGFGEKDVCGLLLAMENINEVKFPR